MLRIQNFNRIRGWRIPLSALDQKYAIEVFDSMEKHNEYVIRFTEVSNPEPPDGLFRYTLSISITKANCIYAELTTYSHTNGIVKLLESEGYWIQRHDIKTKEALLKWVSLRIRIHI